VVSSTDHPKHDFFYHPPIKHVFIDQAFTAKLVRQIILLLSN
jgi:hypothetical protein